MLNKPVIVKHGVQAEVKNEQNVMDNLDLKRFINIKLEDESIEHHYMQLLETIEYYVLSINPTLSKLLTDPANSDWDDLDEFVSLIPHAKIIKLTQKGERIKGSLTKYIFEFPIKEFDIRNFDVQVKDNDKLTFETAEAYLMYKFPYINGIFYVENEFLIAEIITNDDVYTIHLPINKNSTITDLIYTELMQNKHTVDLVADECEKINVDTNDIQTCKTSERYFYYED